jgi:hypothetical protein
MPKAVFKAYIPTAEGFLFTVSPHKHTDVKTPNQQPAANGRLRQRGHIPQIDLVQ